MNYQEQFDSITNIVNEVDPDGLIQGGASHDEYSSEVASILGAMKHSTSEEELIERLERIFTEPANPAVYKLLAAKLWATR
jgi:hypothetical protein